MQDDAIISIRHLSKVYPSGFAALMKKLGKRPNP
jgi:hypothetical protein